MLRELAKFESECKAKSKDTMNKSQEDFQTLLKQFQTWNEKVNQIQLKDTEAEQIIKNVEKSILELEDNIKKSRLALLQNRTCQFKENAEKVNIGELNIFNFKVKNIFK